MNRSVKLQSQKATDERKSMSIKAEYDQL